MLVQYGYALLTMVPCPLWFWYRWLSASFLLSVFSWSVYNGATYYIDVFGTRFQKELEQLKKEVSRWQTSPETIATSDDPAATPQTQSNSEPMGNGGPKRSSSVDGIAVLESKDQSSTGSDTAKEGEIQQRR